MRLNNTVEMLELKTMLANGPGVIHPALVWDEQNVVLFDAGLPNTEGDLKKAAIAAGAPIQRLDHILITHSDMDHIGSLSQIIRSNRQEITVLAHEMEKPYIQCEVPPLRLEQMEKNAGKAVGAMREQLVDMVESLKKNYTIFKAEVNKTVEDGEVLPLCGGITCIFTPGHTPGHMCYYLNDFHLLIAGDILQIDNNKLTRCPDFTIVDERAVTDSLKKLDQYDIQNVVCYHGGLYQGDVHQCIKEIVNSVQ